MKLANYIREQNDGDIILMKFSGWLNYLNTEHSIEVIEKLDKNQQVLLSFSHMGDIDIDWVEAIEHMIEHLEWKNITVYCSWLSHKSNHMITKTHTYRSLVKKLRTFPSTSDWLKFLLHETVN
jgi:MFS superfamily sulfate permease-like transporter